MAAQAYYTAHYSLILSSDYVHILGLVPTVNEVSLRLFFILRSTPLLYSRPVHRQIHAGPIIPRVTAPVSPPDDGLPSWQITHDGGGQAEG